MIFPTKFSACYLGVTTALIVTLPVSNAQALTSAEVDAVAWQVSVLISPNLTQRGDAFLIPGEKTGSGAIVARNGNTYYVLTALHVVLKKGGVHAIATPDGQVYYVDASENSPDIIPLGHISGELGQTIAGMDLALIKFTSDRNYPLAKIAQNSVQLGEAVFVSGWPNPDDLRNTTRDRTIAQGAIAQIVSPPSPDGGYSLLYSNPTHSGMSGGGIFNANGELIGIHGRGRGANNNCSTPEVNANNSCGMKIGDFLTLAVVQNLNLTFDRTAVDYATIQSGLSANSQLDRVSATSLPVTQSPTAIAPPPTPVPTAIVPTASPEAIATASTIYYVNPTTGNNAASAGKTPDNPFRSISYAIQGASPGTVIYLAPGEYSTRETFPLKLNSGVTLIGNESEQGAGITIRGGGWESTVTAGRQNYTIFAGNNSQILGITITNPHENGTGVWIDDTATAVIRNNTFANSDREGIFVGGTANPIVEKNRFDSNRGNGISLGVAATGEIRGNDFNNNSIGLAIAATAAPIVTDNHIRANHTGVVVTESASPIFQGNIFERNKHYGILEMGTVSLESANNNLFRDNGVSDRLIAKTQQWGLDLPAKQDSLTVFGCVEYDRGLATFAQQGAGSIPLPIMQWKDTELESGWNRCRLVTSSLNKIVTLTDSGLGEMAIATGRLNNNNAVCLVDGMQGVCREDNLLFYLADIEQRDPAQVLGELLSFGFANWGNPVQQVATGAIASLDEFARQLQPQRGLWFAD